MICLLKEQLVVLGGVILKLEEFEGAASEKDGGSGKWGGGALFLFLHRKSILSCFGPQHSKKWWWCFLFYGGGGGGGSLFFSWGGVTVFFMKETLQSNVSCLRKQHDGRDLQPPSFRLKVQRDNHCTTVPPQALVPKH